MIYCYVSQVEIRLINIDQADEFQKKSYLKKSKFLDSLVLLLFFKLKTKLSTLIKPLFITKQSNEKNKQKVCRLIASSFNRKRKKRSSGFIAQSSKTSN